MEFEKNSLLIFEDVYLVLIEFSKIWNFENFEYYKKDISVDFDDEYLIFDENVIYKIDIKGDVVVILEMVFK